MVTWGLAYGKVERCRFKIKMARDFTILLLFGAVVSSRFRAKIRPQSRMRYNFDESVLPRIYLKFA